MGRQESVKDVCPPTRKTSREPRYLCLLHLKTHGLVLISLYPPQDPTHAAHSPVPAQLTPALSLSSDTVLVCSGFHNTQFYSFKPAQSLSMCRPLTPEGLPRPLQRTCKVKTIFALVLDQYLTSHTVLTCALMSPKHK